MGIETLNVFSTDTGNTRMHFVSEILLKVVDDILNNDAHLTDIDNRSVANEINGRFFRDTEDFDAAIFVYRAKNSAYKTSSNIQADDYVSQKESPVLLRVLQATEPYRRSISATLGSIEFTTSKATIMYCSASSVIWRPINMRAWPRTGYRTSS